MILILNNLHPGTAKDSHIIYKTCRGGINWKWKRYKPVLLLDDVLSELDEDRRRYLIKSFSGLQTIITSADVIRLKEIDNLDKKTFYIEKGKVM